MSGLHFLHCDSGRPCSSHQSPVALNAAERDGSQRVHCDSGTPCSSHQSSCDPGVTLAGACALGAPCCCSLRPVSVTFLSLSQPARAKQRLRIGTKIVRRSIVGFPFGMSARPCHPAARGGVLHRASLPSSARSCASWSMFFGSSCEPVRIRRARRAPGATVTRNPQAPLLTSVNSEEDETVARDIRKQGSAPLVRRSIAAVEALRPEAIRPRMEKRSHVHSTDSASTREGSAVRHFHRIRRLHSTRHRRRMRRALRRGLDCPA
jgi:hypothetical protein